MSPDSLLKYSINVPSFLQNIAKKRTMTKFFHICWQIQPWWHIVKIMGSLDLVNSNQVAPLHVKDWILDTLTALSQKKQPVC